MVIVVITLAKGDERQDEGISRAAFRGIRLAAKNVASAVDEERAVLQSYDPRDAREKKRSQRTAPSVPQETKQRWENETHHDRNPLNVSVLPDNQSISLEIRDIVVGFGWIQFENQPADVRKKETFRDAVGVIVVIDVLVMAAMFARPHENRVLERGGPEDEREEAHRPRRLESDMREKPVIAQADAESACKKHQKKERDLKPVESEMPEIERDRREREYERADEERTGRPVDAMEWKTGQHKV